MKNIQALSGMPLDELTELLAPLPRFHAVQIIKWIASGVYSFDAMNNLPLLLRKKLSEHYALRPPVTVEKHSDGDSTVKLVLGFDDEACIETVLLSDRTERQGALRHTACLSTQSGCPAGCVFCKTGTAFVRDLTSAEIVEQFLQLRILAEESAPRFSEQSPIANIVIMGMGEPLLNIAELRRSLDIFTCKQGFNLSRRRITVSTCGIAQGIIELADKGPAVRLAFSLTTGDEALRRRLMPITEGQSLRRVKEALMFFQARGGGRITLEAVLMGGINTRNEDAQGIAQFAKGLNAVVNLIPWNPVKGLEFEGKALRQPSENEVKLFTRQLETLGLKVTRRYRRGRGVSGACGQLSSNR